MHVRDKVVVVTGGAHGIGAALCRRFHAEGAAAIAVADVDAAGAAIVAAEVGGRFYACDVSNAQDVARMAASVEAELGPIALYASNAGVLDHDPDPHDAASATDAAWARSFGVNVMGHVNAARAVLPGMIARGGGAILATVSAAGLLSQVGSATYSVSKHAALAYCEYLAFTHRADGIKVMALCPMGVDTAMTKGATGREPALLDGILSAEAVAQAAVEGLAAERFLILPHPQVVGYARAKSDDYDRWIAGMAKLHRAQFASRA